MRRCFRRHASPQGRLRLHPHRNAWTHIGTAPQSPLHRCAARSGSAGGREGNFYRAPLSWQFARGRGVSLCVQVPIGTDACVWAGAAWVPSPVGATTLSTPPAEPQAASASVPPIPNPNRPSRLAACRRDTRDPKPGGRPASTISRPHATFRNSSYGYTGSRTRGFGPSYPEKCSTPQAWHASSAAAGDRSPIQPV